MNEHEHFNSQQSSSTLHTFTICTTNMSQCAILFAHAEVVIIYQDYSWEIMTVRDR